MIVASFRLLFFVCRNVSVNIVANEDDEWSLLYVTVH